MEVRQWNKQIKIVVKEIPRNLQTLHVAIRTFFLLIKYKIYRMSRWSNMHVLELKRNNSMYSISSRTAYIMEKVD